MEKGSSRTPNPRPVILYEWLQSQIERFGPESTAHCISEEEALALFPVKPKGPRWASSTVHMTGTTSVNVLLAKLGSEWHCRHVNRDFVFTRRRHLRASLYFLPLEHQPTDSGLLIAKVGFTSRPVVVRAKELRFDTPVALERGKVVTVRSVHGFRLEGFLHELFERDGRKVTHNNKDGTTATELFSFTPEEWDRVQPLDLFDLTEDEAKDALVEMLLAEQGDEENVEPMTPKDCMLPCSVTPILPPESGPYGGVGDESGDISALIDRLSFVMDE